ncbi:MAG: tRNA 2-thiouridine(34) synthase MnmA [Oscillospiraceae bacterium]
MDKTVVLGLSGGVDSAVAAARLKESGWQVHCVYLDIGLGGSADAAAVAAGLDLPFETVNIQGELEEHVCAPFAADYLAGRTPIPCAKCNPTVKFPALLKVADRLGFEKIATGHYANTALGENGRTLLLRGKPANDQSYMLARLPQSILQRVLFPLGEDEKTAIRLQAGDKTPTVAEKPDSMEICFVPGGDYAAWLDARGKTPPPGDFVDKNGTVLGRHLGLHHYTLGQGKGLNLSGPHRYFVTELRPETNQVVLSDGTDLGRTAVFCTDPNWISIENLTAELSVTVRLRHSKTETAATIAPAESGVKITGETEFRAPTPGQLAVFYRGEVVVGSGWIR